MPAGRGNRRFPRPRRFRSLRSRALGVRPGTDSASAPRTRGNLTSPRPSGRRRLAGMTEPTPPTQPQETERLSGGQTSTDVLEREEVRQKPDAGDSERYAHYVRKDKVTQAAVSGGPVIALCGKVWTPNRDPKKFPICPACKEIYEGMNQGDGEDGGSGRGRGFFGFGSKK